MKVKICGITNLIDAKNAINSGADYIGFVNIQSSPRFVTTQEIEEMVKHFSEKEKDKIVLLTDSSSIDSLVKLSTSLHFKIIQPYSSISRENLNKLRLLGYRIFKPLSIASEEDLEQINEYQNYVDLIILDTKSNDPNILGGTGMPFDWNLYVQAKSMSNIELGVAGGINPNNVTKLIEQCKPNLIDVSSGLEKQAGIKSLEKIKAFMEIVSSSSLKL